MQAQRTETLDRQGWLLLESVYPPHQLNALQSAAATLSTLQDEAVRVNSGSVYAARNVLELVPEFVYLWQTPVLVNLLHETLGDEVGLVRALFFDKPPTQTWSLPWHKDLLIAVQRASVSTPGYSKLRLRAGVLHTEPPLEVLCSMLTLRLHLDEMTLENGPLEVLSGSHQTGKTLCIDGFSHHQIISTAGAVFAMRPLLVHASSRSVPYSTQHRRVLHLEFCGMPNLPGGMQWYAFHPLHPNPSPVSDDNRFCD